LEIGKTLEPGRARGGEEARAETSLGIASYQSDPAPHALAESVAAPMGRSPQTGIGEGRAPAPADDAFAATTAPFDPRSFYVTADPASIRLLEQAEKVALSGSTVLVRGESGTGKDLLASLLHYLGPNRDAALVKIDCASLPLELVESELFGYERGAFTGAIQMKRGRLELAGNGTLVLDEVAALTMPMQAKLLRVIDEKRFERLGGTRPIAVEARIIALTNVDLERAVMRRTFREDLYYRLNVIPLVVPPLRERPGDIRPLAEHFLAQLTEVHRKPRMAISTAAMAALVAYSYPGNVRELRNLLERAVIYAGAPEILPQDLPGHVRQASGGGKKMSLEQLERAYIAEVLDFTHGKKTMAAGILGISRKTLLEKRKRYGLD
jgi:two-component system response regulator AtoC